MLTTCDALRSEMESNGIPKIFIPTADVSRFGHNMFLIGFVDDPLDINCIETVYPATKIPLKLTPWLRPNLERVPHHPTETIEALMQCNLCGEAYNNKYFLEHFQTHQESLTQVIENTDVFFNLEIAKEIILSHSMDIYNKMRNEMTLADSPDCLPSVDVARFGANVFIFIWKRNKADETQKVLPVSLLPWMTTYLTQKCPPPSWFSTILDTVSTFWRNCSQQFQNIVSTLNE